jgi:hypothetical protein
MKICASFMARELGSAAIHLYREFRRSSLRPEAWGTVLVSLQASLWARSYVVKLEEYFA